MKLMVKNKKIIIICISILIVAIIGIYYIRKNTDTTDNVNDLPKDNAYIDIWRDNSIEPDIALHSIGSGADEKLYLGAQPFHYLIYKNGDIYTYQASSYQNKMTGERDPSTSKYKKKVSQPDLEKIENKLKSIVENNKNNSFSALSTYWYIKINGESTRVDINVYEYVLEQYLDENYTQTINKRNLENSIHDFIKENYATNQTAVYTGPFNMFSLTDEEKNIIMYEYKKENSNIKYSDDELLDIIDKQAGKIWSESIESLIENSIN